MLTKTANLNDTISTAINGAMALTALAFASGIAVVLFRLALEVQTEIAIAIVAGIHLGLVSQMLYNRKFKAKEHAIPARAVAQHG